MKLSRGLISFGQVLGLCLAVSTPAFAQSRDINVLSADQTWEGAQPGARAGAWLDQGALRARTSQTDHRRDLIIGAPGGAGLIGKVHVIYGGPVRVGAQILSSADATINGEAAGDLFGTSTAAGNILTLEGVEPKNLAVGAPGASGGRGAVYLFAGSFGVNDVIASSAAVLKIIGAPGDQLGAMLATADLNNDGYREIVIGAPGTNRVYVIRGGPSLSGTQDLTVTPAQMTISLAGIGGVLTAGDVTGDNIQDLIIGAPTQNTIYLFAGAGAFPTAPTAIFTGLDAGDMAGASLRIADMDADGKRDLMIGAPGGDGAGNTRPDAGEVYLLWGGAALLTSRSMAEADVTFIGRAGERLGASIAGGDVNRDTPNDAVILAEAAASNTGILYIYYGRARTDFGSARPDGRRDVDFALAGQVDRRIGSGPTIGAIRSAQVFEVTGEGARDIIVGIPTLQSNAGLLYFTLSPKMVLSQTSFTLATTRTAQAQRGVTVANETPIPISWAAAADQAWLTATASGSAVGGAPGSLTITVNPAGLDVGTYTGTVTISSSSPDLTIGMPITVTYTVTETMLGLDSPAPGTTVTQPFNIGGWALDRSSTSGSGVDAIHIWAFPVSGDPVFLAATVTGGSRPDVGAAFGNPAFNTSGFNAPVIGLLPGQYTIAVYVHNARTGSFDNAQAVFVTVRSSAIMNIDTHTDGALLNPSFYMAGWAIDAAAATGTGVDTVHVWAFPQNGGGATFLGVATYGDARPDLGTIVGARFTNSGWHLNVTGLAPGLYTIAVYAHSTVSGDFTDSRGFTATVLPSGRMNMDAPGSNATVGRPFQIAGWAIDLAATSGPGVDTVHVWATPTNGGSPTFLGVASYGIARSDVGSSVGNHQFDNCGFSLVAGGSLAPGTYTISVYGHSTVANDFTIVQVRVVTVQ